MGNKKPVETKKRKKKKGRPSLLDLQKRKLEEERIANPNSYRRSTRRNPSPIEVEEEGESNGERKEKKLKLVSGIAANGPELAEPGSDSGGTCKRRKLDSAVETARQSSNPKATDPIPPQGDASDSGPTTTPLPDKKLLVFILDRLQKKDTYGVFSEPVDPEELPDYHEIIEHPMDFGTVRKKLDSGAYENMEQFESDIFLICSNAMQYNSSETVYFRQARSIQELAKKDFENLRQESDDDEPTIRRGRPSIKSVMKQIARAPADRTVTACSFEASLANVTDGIHNSSSAHDLSRKGSSSEKLSMIDASIRSAHAYRGNAESRSERNEEYSGSPLKGIPMKHWKKFSNIDENRRNTYFQPVQPSSFQELSFFTAFKRERKLLMPVGAYMEHAYCRSLARFAANLGPIGWEITAKKIQKVLPPGTKFGPGWVGSNTGNSHQFRPGPPPPQLSSPPDSSSQSNLSQSGCTTLSGSDTLAESHQQTRNNSASASASPSTGRPVNVDYPEIAQGMISKSPLINGFKPGCGSNLPSQYGRPAEVAPTHARNTQFDTEEKDRSIVCNSSSFQPNSGTILPPDLNVDVQSQGSTVPKQHKKQELAL